MKKIILALLSTLFFSTSLLAEKIHGIEIVETASVGNQTLILNGAGTRTKWFFKVYVGCLYLDSKSADSKTILANTNAKRIELHMLRSLKKKKMVGAIVTGFKANTKDMASIQASVDQFIQYMEKVKKGDTIQFDFIPTSGTNIIVNGNNKGVISGKDFFDALIKVWLGDKPADKSLKAAMLGN